MAGLVVSAVTPVATTDAALTGPTTNPGNAFTARADWRAPIATRFAIAETTAASVPVGHPAYVRSGGNYCFVSDAVDDPSSNHPVNHTRAGAVLAAPNAYPGGAADLNF